ncbi:MAG: replicative DNA helicase [SAR202 cluster bacterium Io17-Chloro-G3]|nr:MAG: replicative DNA helicase [SAR202 cluster bacterium Io17-Chloro-G3]
MYNDRLPPHDSQAENSVIGSLLLDGDSLTKVSAFLKPEDFYLDKNRFCYEACLNLTSRNEAVNQVTVSHELSIHDRLTPVGGTSYLSSLVNSTPSPTHISHYGQIVHRTSVMRQLIQAAGGIAQIGYENAADTEDSLSRAEEVLFDIRSGRGSRDFEHIREVLDTYLEESLQGPEMNTLAPVPCGFDLVDQLLGGGLQRSDLIILAARPSLGKSTLAFNMATSAAKHGNNVGIFSLEMSAGQIGNRLISSESNVDSHRLRLQLYTDLEERRIFDAIGSLSDLQIFIDDTPIQTIVEMRSKARRLQAERGLDLIIVDYLQLIGGTGGRNANRVQEMGEISRSLKGMARDLNVPVLACSQLSRAIEQRPDHRPMLSDLRESGSIEQDADVVAFIHREDRYVDAETWEKRNPTEEYPSNIADLIVAKHRNGRTGGIKLYFQDRFVKFENLATYEQEPISVP